MRRRRTVRRAVYLFLGALVLAQGAFSPVQATPEATRAATDLYGQIMSPYCPGVTLSACSSGKASALRQEIKLWLLSGVGEAEVRARLESRFGEEVFGLPSGGSFRVVAWLAPILAAVLGFFVMLIMLKRSLRRNHSEPEQAPKRAEEIERELERRRDARR